ncbi:MAG: hypothetical protein JJ975_02920 [Bacteroidia bacterium]|nr:hypothetical protein [Bacteroidia bacterium]
MNFRLVLAGFLLLAIGCREVEQPQPIGKDYFPIAVGNEWVYSIDSIFYDGFNEKRDSFRYYRREVVTEVFESDGGEQRFSADVFFKTDSTDWKYKSTFTLYKNDYRGVRITNNNQIMHLLFPVKNKVSWDANQLNAMREDRFRYLSSELHRTSLADSFPAAIFVEHEYDSTVIDADIRWELYAENTGLVEKKTLSTTTQFNKTDGFQYHWKLISFTSQ